jgi:transcription antitermination factor NusG
MDDGKAWYCLEAIEGRTTHAVLLLAVARMEVWRPFVTKRAPDRRGRSKTPGPRKDRSYPRFGRYFFVRCDLTDSLFHEIRHAPFIRGFLCASGTDKPHMIPDAEIEWLRDPVNLRERPIGWEASFRKGQRVTICEDYPLWGGMSGIISAIDSRGAVKIDIDAKFGRAVPVVIEIGHVREAAALAKPPKAPNDNRSRPVFGPAA